MKDFDKFIEEAATKRCPPGKYYDGNRCIIVPRGYHVGRGGYIEPDEDGENGKSNNGTGNGNGHSSNGNGGNGNGNGGNGGGGNGG
jgi:hypothetical protein